MMCIWEPLRNVLPQKIRSVLQHTDMDCLQEIRLRLGTPLELNYGSRFVFTDHTVTREEISFVINAASRYSPWSAATASQGYITIPGGHRIGLCGEMISGQGRSKGFRWPESLCIRIAKDYPGLAKPYSTLQGSVLILGAPGWGKTTLLRDLARQRAEIETTVVVDERGELFPEGYLRGKRMDVLRLCPKKEGIDLILRTMGPSVIAVDEITQQEDCEAILSAANCGVHFLATAHGYTIKDLRKREIYRMLCEQGVFDHILCMNPDKTCVWERRCS